MTRREWARLAAGAVGAGGVGLAQQAAAKPPNFVVLFADDLGYGDLGCYGHPNIRTPNLDRMADEGVRFTSFYAAAPVCSPSRAALLTGRYAVRAGLPNNLGPDSTGGLPLSEVLLPQVLKRRGYRTMAVGKWHLGHQPVEHLPTRRGFDSFLGLPYSNDMIPPWVATRTPLFLYRDAERVEELGDQSTLTERYTAEALRFVRDAGDNPFFLYLPYAMPHLPVSAPARFRGRSRAGLYGDVIETLDWSAGEILRTLKERGIDERTMVVFASDNGPWHNLPPRMLQNGVQPWHTGSKSLLRGAKDTTYEGGQRVPGIVRWPGRIPARRVESGMASTLDLFPTMVDAASGTMPEGRVYDGAGLMPALEGRAPLPRSEFYYFRGKVLEAVRDGAWKYRKVVEQELFNLDWDPAEQYNVYNRERERADRMFEKMRVFAKQVNASVA